MLDLYKFWWLSSNTCQHTFYMNFELRGNIKTPYCHFKVIKDFMNVPKILYLNLWLNLLLSRGWLYACLYAYSFRNTNPESHGQFPLQLGSTGFPPKLQFGLTIIKDIYIFFFLMNWILFYCVLFSIHILWSKNRKQVHFRDNMQLWIFIVLKVKCWLAAKNQSMGPFHC